MGDCLRTGKPSQYTTNTKVNFVFRPSGVGKLSTGLLGWVKAGHVHLCRVAGSSVWSHIWKVMLRSSEIGYHWELETTFNLLTFLCSGRDNAAIYTRESIGHGYTRNNKRCSRQTTKTRTSWIPEGQVMLWSNIYSTSDNGKSNSWRRRRRYQLHWLPESFWFCIPACGMANNEKV